VWLFCVLIWPLLQRLTCVLDLAVTDELFAKIYNITSCGYVLSAMQRVNDGLCINTLQGLDVSAFRPRSVPHQR